MIDGDFNTLNKLVLLYIFDKMDMPITDNTVLELVTSRNAWLSYMDCQLTLGQLVDSNFLHITRQDKSKYYTITPDGRMCVSHFYHKIDTNLQEEIAHYIKHNRRAMRRNQEYYRHYYKNPDGTYTVTLKIIDPAQTTLEIKLHVDNRQSAKQAYERWEEKAANTFFWLHEQLVDN